MSTHEIILAGVQAVLCLTFVAAVRVVLVHAGPRFAALLAGMPMVMFPMLVLQAWQGLPITQLQTLGSLGSMAAASGAMWVLRYSRSLAPFAAIGWFVAAWLLLVFAAHYLALPAEPLVLFIAASTVSVTVWIRLTHHMIPAADGPSGISVWIPVLLFLIIFFLVLPFVSTYVRGVLVSFPIGLMSTIYIAYRSFRRGASREFVIWMQASVLSSGVFLIFLHYAVGVMGFPAALTCAVGGAFGASFLSSRILKQPATTSVSTGVV